MNINKKLLSDLLELSEIYNKIDQKFKAKAFYNGYYILNKMKENNKLLPETKKELVKIKGIGSSIADIILNYKRLNHIPILKEFKDNKKLEKIISLSEIYGIGIKKAINLYEKSNVKSIKELQNAYNLNKVHLTPMQILGLIHHKDLIRKIPNEEIKMLDENIQKNKDKIKYLDKFYILGSYRRQKKLSGDIDMMVLGSNQKVLNNVIEFLKKEYKYVGTLSHGKKKFMGLFIIDKYVRHIDIIFTNYEDYPTKLLYFTGSKDFNIYMRNIAINLKFKLSDKGLFDSHGKKIKLKNEKEIFKILKMEYVPPNKR